MSTLDLNDLIDADLSLICRGCLTTSGEMKNMVEWGLVDDFYRLTNVQVNRSDNPSLLLCVTCEDVLMRCRSFKLKCHQSDIILKNALENRLSKESKQSESQDVSISKENTVHCELRENELTIRIITRNMDSKIYLPCPFECRANFLKRTTLLYHLMKYHNKSKDFIIDLQFYCPITECVYSIDSGKNKHFPGRKNVNQHTFKVHGEKIICDKCNLAFSSNVDYKRHLKMCSYIYICQVCDKQFITNEKLLIHLLRKHPEVHKQYKNERKSEKRKYVDNVEAKKAKIECDRSVYTCESPKRSFATQTLELDKHIKNDVTLPSWQASKKDEISTQTMFEDLLSLKSNLSEDDVIFSDTVSLSDIQTQTTPLEFGLSRSNKETITSETQSPDLSIKETQTCFCLYELLKPNSRFTDSVALSPSNTFSVLTSTETQTLDLRESFDNDVMSFTSAETQTCFDEDSNKGI